MNECHGCGRMAETKVVGHYDEGRGDVALLCSYCRHPARVVPFRNARFVRPWDAEFEARQKEIEALRAAEAEAKKKKAEAEVAQSRARKKPGVGKTGKTERKRKAKANRK